MEIFFIVSGSVSIIHKKTRSHLIDLQTDDCFGEISFFSELP